jgi:hypothetical protein
MGILKDLLSEIKESDMTTQIRIICDEINSEEKANFKYPELLPKGPLIFLSLEVPGRNTKEIGFLTLERESEEVYTAVYSTLEKHRIQDNIEKTVPPRRRKVWVIDENSAEKILTQFAKKLKMFEGKQDDKNTIRSKIGH